MSGWPEAELADALADTAPGFACGDDVEDGVFQFRMNNLTPEGRLDLGRQRRVPRDYRNIERYLLEPGDVLFNATNSPDLVGKTAFFAGLEEPAVFSNHFLRLRPLRGRLDGRFLSRWLNLQFQRGRFKAMCRQWVNQATVNRDALLAMRIPLPSLPEQRRIVEILDRADTLRDKRRTTLAQLDDLTQSIFVDMFGDPFTNPKGWPRLQLDEVFDIARGGSPRPIDDYITDSPDGINWIMIGDASEGSKYITRTKKRIRPEGARRSRAVEPGDFLLTNSMSFGRPYILRTSGCIHDGWLVLSPRQGNVDPDYFYELLSSRSVFIEFIRRAPGATVKNLNIDLVRAVTLPVAPIAKQKEFAQAVAGIERSAEAFTASNAKLDDLFASLQHRAYRGEL